MAKKTRRAAAADASAGENPRRPCPCGSGKRYKACHGAGDDVIVTRPFAGLAAECELVAMREFLPSATAPLPTRDGQQATVATVLPGASAALVRPNGEVLLGMQVQTRSGDLSADIARALRWAREAEPGTALPVVPPTGGDAVRLQDVLDADAPVDLTIHADFTWWLTPEDAASPSAEVAATLERANAVIMPTEAVSADDVRAAYWVDTGAKAHLRWVRPEPEERLDRRARPAAGGRRTGSGRGQPVRRVVPGARARRAGVGPRPREARQGVGRAGGGVRGAVGRGAGGRRAADRRRAPGAGRAGGQAGHPALTACARL